MDLGLYGVLIAGIARRPRDIAPIKIYYLRARMRDNSEASRRCILDDGSRFTRGYRARSHIF